MYTEAMFGTAVVLAGGKSTRMGFDKQLLTVNNLRIVENSISKLKTIFKDIIIISDNPGYYEIKGIRICPDIIKGFGPLSGIHAGLANAASRYVYFLACDMPVVNTEYISYMMKRLSGGNHDACITKNGIFIEPFNSFYSANSVQILEEQFLEGSLSINSFISKIDCLYIEESDAKVFCRDFSMFLNLNNRDELKRYASSKAGEVG